MTRKPARADGPSGERARRASWRRRGARLGLLTAVALVAARDGLPLAAAAPVCPQEAACGFKKPLVLFVVDYSTAMNEEYDPYRTRWKAAVEAITGLMATNDGLLRTHFMLGLLRYGHDPDPALPGTAIPGDASGLIDGTAVDVAPYDLLGPGHAYHECTNAEAIVAALGALPPPLAGQLDGIDRWTSGGLERARAVLEQAAKDHPDEPGERPAAIVLLTAGAWTGPAGGAPLVPPTEDPASAAQALYVAGVPTYVVTLGDAIDAPFAAALAGAGGTGQPLAIACPSAPWDALDPLGVALEQEIGGGTCGQQAPRAMVLIDASSSMLNLGGGTQHALQGQGGWDLLRDSLIGSGSIFAHAVMNDPGRRVEDLAYIGLAVFGGDMPPEEKIVVDYGPCLAENIAWALDPASSCAQPGCGDPWGGPPISWTFQDGSLVDPPGFTRETLSHMPRCDQNGPIPQACSGSATYTHRGLLLVAQNLASHRQACMQPDAPNPCTESTPFFNVLITDGLYNSTDAQVQAPLKQMHADGVVTHVIGFGDAIGSPQVSASLAKLADWGSGGLRAPHAAADQDQLEGALAAIFDEALADVALDPCCAGICDPPPVIVPDEPDPPPETSWGEYCGWSDGGDTDGSSTGGASTTASTASDTGDDTTGDDPNGEPTTSAATTTSTSGGGPTDATSEPATTAPASGTDSPGEGGTDDGTGATDGDGGCGCASAGDRTGWSLLLLLGLSLRRRRRESAGG